MKMASSSRLLCVGTCGDWDGGGKGEGEGVRVAVVVACGSMWRCVVVGV